MTKKTLFAAAAVLAGFGAWARDPEMAKAPYMNAKLSCEERCRDLISRMTIAEKVAILSTTSGFKTYEIVDGEVRPTQYLRDLYEKFREEIRPEYEKVKEPFYMDDWETNGWVGVGIDGKYLSAEFQVLVASGSTKDNHRYYHLFHDTNPTWRVMVDFSMR